MPSYLGADDNYLPLISKPSLQQYDNYQIHDLYCVDIVESPTNIKLFKQFLAVERVSPHGEINCDFNQIAELYE
jgi:hypothetical protein